MRADALGAQRHVFRMHAQRRDEVFERLQLGLRWQALQLARTPRFERHPGFEIPVPDTDVRAGDGKRKTLLAHAERLLGALALGVVDADAGDAHNAAVGVAEDLRTRCDPEHGAVALHDAVLEIDPR